MEGLVSLSVCAALAAVATAQPDTPGAAKPVEVLAQPTAGVQPGSAPAASFGLGQPSPMIEVAEWIKGDSFERFEPGTVYVLDFWATWCMPCIGSIPHISELQERYKDNDVVVVGVSSPDARGNSLEKTRRFALEGAPTREGDVHQMDYTVVFAKGRSTWEAYARTGWDQSIPHVFIIDRQGRLAWHGHPIEMDEVLEKVAAGTYDIEAEAALARRRAELQTAARPMIDELRREHRAGNVTRAIDIAAEVAALDYRLFADIATWRYIQLVKVGRTDEAAEYAADLIERRWPDSWKPLNTFAWRIASDTRTAGRDLNLALHCAERALELTEGKQADVFDTLARVRFERGEIGSAIEAQEKALELAPAPMKREMQATLDRYKAEKAAQG